MPLTIKICGLMTEEDVRLCLRLGIRHLGFVVEYPESVPWNISREKARELVRLAEADGETVKTYMVCGGRTEEILRMARYLRPAAIQIHHREAVGEVARIAETLLREREREGGIKTYRAVSPETPGDELAALCALPELAGLVADSRTPDTAATHGRRLDAGFYARLRARLPRPRAIFLGGGITPDNVREILDATRADAIDILTGVESIPGRKDENKLRRILERISGEQPSVACHENQQTSP